MWVFCFLLDSGHIEVTRSSEMNIAPNINNHLRSIDLFRSMIRSLWRPPPPWWLGRTMRQLFKNWRWNRGSTWSWKEQTEMELSGYREQNGWHGDSEMWMLSHRRISVLVHNKRRSDIYHKTGVCTSLLRLVSKIPSCRSSLVFKAPWVLKHVATM